MRKLASHQITRPASDELAVLPRHPLVAVLDDIRSAHNVGSIFRTADALRIERVICCGYSPTPVHLSVAKTALGAEQTVPWHQEFDAVHALRHLRFMDYLAESEGHTRMSSAGLIPALVRTCGNSEPSREAACIATLACSTAVATDWADARALALHIGVRSGPSEEWIPDSYFINLETLFESAVLQALREVGDRWNGVDAGARQGVYLLADSRLYEAEPDIVVGASGRVGLVGDCKYKDLQVRPEPDDVYQLIAHCRAFGSSLGLIIYPGDGTMVERLGSTIGGVEVYCGTVSLRDLAMSSRELVEDTLGRVARDAA
jgi:hypothetical protein